MYKAEKQQFNINSTVRLIKMQSVSDQSPFAISLQLRTTGSRQVLHIDQMNKQTTS